VTANIAYRRSAFERVDGFHEGFPHPHCEDLDLAFRIVRLGRIGFAPGMRVVHPPKSMSVRQQLRRGRMTSSEVVLRARHPELFRDYLWLPIRLRPPINLIRDRVRLLRHRRRARDLSLRRVTLWGVVTGGQAAIAVVGCLRQAPTSGD
jgi:GT2 family glycosyltransferase